MSKIYIVQDQKDLDLSAAKPFGEIEYVFPARTNIYEIDALRKMAIDKLKDFKEEEDYFLIVGNRVLNIILFFILIDKYCIDKLKVLIYQSMTKTYVERVFIFESA